jgi:hypothetical protein
MAPSSRTRRTTFRSDLILPRSGILVPSRSRRGGYWLIRETREYVTEREFERRFVPSVPDFLLDERRGCRRLCCRERSYVGPAARASLERIFGTARRQPEPAEFDEFIVASESEEPRAPPPSPIVADSRERREPAAADVSCEESFHCEGCRICRPYQMSPL